MINFENKQKKTSNIYKIALIVFIFFGFVNFSFALTVGVQTPNAGGDTLKNGLIGWWTFDGTDVVSNVQDKSGNSNTGYMINMATSTAKVLGKLGQAFKFDGSNDYVTTSSTFTPTDNFTASAWAYVDSFTGSYNTIFSTRTYIPTDNFGIWAQSSGSRWYIQAFGDGVDVSDASISMQTKKWYHVVLVKSSVSPYVRFYVDGVLRFSSTNNPGTLTSRQLDFGTYSTTLGPLNGRVDDARIYNRVFSASEIKQLYNQGVSRLNATTASTTPTNLNSGLVGHWTFDGADLVSNVVDKSGNGNNGNMFGFTSTTTAKAVGKLGQALKFDGVDDYVQTTSSLGVYSSYTATAWVKLDNKGAYANYGIFVADKTSPPYGGYSLYIRKSDGAVGRWDSGVGQDFVYSSTNKIAFNKWQFIAIRSSIAVSGWIEISVNGSSWERIFTGDTSTEASGNNICIGRWCGGNHYASGFIDDARIYSRTLSVSEVQQLYNQGVSRLNATTASTTPTNLNSGLVGHWTFDGADLVSNVADKSGNGKNGNMFGFTSTTTAKVIGKLGQALSFGSGNPYIDVNPGITLTTFTLASWFKINNSTSNWRSIISKQTGGGSRNYWLGISALTDATYCSIGSLVILYSVSGVADAGHACSPAVVNDNKWHYGVATYNGTTLKLYVDGVEVGSQTIGAPDTQTAATVLGHYSDHTSYPLRGLMDDTRVYNRALSAFEVKQLYNMGR